MSPEV